MFDIYLLLYSAGIHYVGFVEDIQYKLGQRNFLVICINAKYMYALW